MSLVAGFLLPVILVDMQLVTVLIKGLMAVKERLLLVSLEEECGQGDSSERSRILSEDPVGELAGYGPLAVSLSEDLGGVYSSKYPPIALYAIAVEDLVMVGRLKMAPKWAKATVGVST